MDENPIELQDVKRLNAKPGDVILIRLPEDPDNEVVTNIEQAFERAFGRAVTVFIAGPDVRVEVLTVDPPRDVEGNELVGTVHIRVVEAC